MHCFARGVLVVDDRRDVDVDRKQLWTRERPRLPSTRRSRNPRTVLAGRRYAGVD
jgi:hypothetical protein